MYTLKSFLNKKEQFLTTNKTIPKNYNFILEMNFVCESELVQRKIKLYIQTMHITGGQKSATIPSFSLVILSVYYIS